MEHENRVGRLMSAQAVRAFMMAGNATLTLKSERTGNRFTYRVNESEDGRVAFVSLMAGTDNEADFQYLGFIRDGLYVHGVKSRIEETAPSASAFSWFHAHLQARRLPEALQVWHEGRCGRCGRKLTVPESVERGFGPECAELIGEAV
jgi:hypothetical protein